MSTAYAFWKASLAGEKPKMFVDDPQCGFYRKSVIERNDKGNNRRVGWTPVAVFMDGDVMTARIGGEISGRDVTGDELKELWNWLAGNAVPEDWYRVAAGGGDWPDAHVSKPMAAAEIVSAGMQADIETSEVTETTEARLLRQLAEHSKGIPTYAKIEDDILLSQAHDLRDKIKKIENEAEKERKAEKDYFLKKGREVDDKWRGVISAAQDEYAKISVPMNLWVNTKLEAARLHDERVAAAAKAHDDAVAAAEAANRPAPPPPVVSAPNLPAPSMQVRSGGGARASNVRVNKIVTITDEAAVYKHFAGSPELTAVLLKLATTAINANLNVPGTTWKPEAKV